jgi:hypothetical protein
VRLIVQYLGFGDAFSAEGRDLASGDEFADTEIRGPRPPLSLEVAARPESIGDGIAVTVRSTRTGRVRLQVRRGHGRIPARSQCGPRTNAPWCSTPRGATGLVTLTARSGSATARARLKPAF